MKNILESYIFNNIKEESIKNILEKIKCVYKEFQEGAVIANEGDECNSLCIIRDGIVQIERIYPSGKYIILNKFKEGDIFGEALVFGDNNKYPAAVMSVTSSKVLFIDKTEVIKLCLEEERVLENFISLLSNKVFILNNKIKSISFNSNKEKVINYLLEESLKEGSDEIILKESKEHIAISLGMPRPSFSRELIKLKDKKLITYDRKKIKIMNKEALEKELIY